jgi:hypothetical protein
MRAGLGTHQGQASCRPWPSDQQDLAPVQWNLMYTSQGGQEGPHVPFRGVSCVTI